MRLQVLIDASPLLLRSAGVKNYFYYWLQALRAEAREEDIRAFPFLGRFGALRHERSILNPMATLPRLAALYLANVPHLPFIDLLASRAGVFHVTNQLRRPIHGCPITATIHDMTAALLPELHTPANVRADEAYSEHVLRRAAGLIAVSENTRQDALRILRLPSERIAVIHPGVAPDYAAVDAGQRAAAARRFGLDRPYVLYVGTIEPRKNVDLLLDAWSALPAEMRSEFHLVVAGPEGWGCQATMARLRAAPAGVRYLGYVPEALLPGLTGGAVLFVYPSLYEGFGFPVVQAMAAGVAVIASNVSSMPEVAGDAGVLIDPRSPHSLQAALRKLLESPSQRTRLGAAARSRAEQFGWDICARKSLDFFRRVAG